PGVKVTFAALVNAGACRTLSVKNCVAGALAPFEATIVKWYAPPADVRPDNVAVPLPLSTKDTPDGSVPVAVNAAAGLLRVLTVNVPKTPASKVAESALVNRTLEPTPTPMSPVEPTDTALASLANAVNSDSSAKLIPLNTLTSEAPPAPAPVITSTR